ncbi:amidohydrolase family protein [Methanobrevibacter filiformis]|uniref:5'-deoxyadenosine deaminase n=1 Tax=Methanobrevibacter filiformis TaxID=55758 RepID=A0A166AUY0_9EURY|nr:amidohydrolase family protein [Methanobrevibacter filiformis]KZX12501.1 5-methylthioadenosine/S-adenosylhomocysteine deaminase [Methanobrevibacter filiformis]
METKNTLIKNITVISPVNNNITNNVQIKKGTSILIENDRIAEISSNISENAIDKVINGNGKIAIPGLINTHTHVPMNLFRGLADDLELDSWLNDHIWPMEANLNGEFTYIGALHGILEMIKTGTTTFNDMYFYLNDIAKAVEESGVRGVLSYGMIDFFDDEKRKTELKESTKTVKEFNGKYDRIKINYGPHSIYTCSKELLIETRALANKYNTGIHIHMSETKKEIDDVYEAQGKHPFEYLEEIGFLGEDVLAAHCVWLNNKEIAIIKENNVKISHNPCSNMKLASGIAPIDKLTENNICVSLGTDGASSNNNLDLFEEMKFASLLQKVNTFNPEVLPAGKILEMATIDAAKALGMENEIGSIEEGKKADIILLDTSNVNLTPTVNSLISHIVYSGNGYNVDTTICNGEILMEDKEVKTLNEQEIIKKTNETVKLMKEA